jgi:predicted ATPase
LGWALSQTGQHDRGLAQLRDGLDAHRATGASMDRPYFLALLAEALGAAGLADEGLSAIAEAIELIGADRSFFYEAELHRLRGALSGQAATATGADEPATSFRRALEIARRQGARSLELRAALSLAQLLRARGASDEARATLSESCAWFGDRTDSADLREARELLGELERDRAPAG